ncbi:flavodoxin family protein [Pseudomonas sp. G11-1]|uniref:NAD(P)H-dependent oxidoreductase n=1 Tax=Halopseudomonas bauzanensis TaxID=653930 RepID=A0A4U0YP02_9GAMM|nr:MULTISPECIES: NAD(P)H-dependent oxidoreductase [Halopseudomonas]MCO5785689.1 flavodoxin family protein [Pseudomonas sp. G11-1]MCO5788207.1 flavodoxin family protein [Pseudomonas sp. G11-2]EZQ19551.1 NAD(P)H dehydrogenase [Halopseudomonas bauzanensis]TKA93255.1 NAD(P)H-dependent oxidoreductase [Halopseudomonas bauzanensis]WGK61281.1 NAD(P)H-dependent oxidoreductase [Halopseudomonas sp. SMJS2]
MHTLIVVAHPELESLTQAVASHIAKGITSAQPQHTFEIADLAQEGFDPRFTAADLTVHRTQASPAADVQSEQTRIDRADALVLVYPVYWWSMPALLKGWIDRVFSNGWAFDFSPGGALIKKLAHLNVHLVGIGGADPGTFERHGYAAAMKTQIDHGIFNYCGAKVLSSHLLLDSETADSTKILQAAQQIGHEMVAVDTHRQVEHA